MSISDINSHIIIRDANACDIATLTSLVSDLGYPASEEEIKQRFENIFSRKEFRTLLAITEGGQTAGMIGMTENYGYEHNAKYVRVLALVVGKNFRNRGIGRLLMTEAEKWATQLDAYMIVLTSGMRDERKAAYAFYQRIGYEIKSSGFVKKLKYD
jgi:GNAT superfamily N-acetyltransferase